MAEERALVVEPVGQRQRALVRVDVAQREEGSVPLEQRPRDVQQARAELLRER